MSSISPTERLEGCLVDEIRTSGCSSGYPEVEPVLPARPEPVSGSDRRGAGRREPPQDDGGCATVAPDPQGFRSFRTGTPMTMSSRGPRFTDRRAAGAELSEHLDDLRTADPIVIGLPRGGVPVAAVVAEALDAPLDLLIARKVGAPGRPEFGIGAIAEGAVRLADHDTLEWLGLGESAFDRLADDEETELERRIARYRGDTPPFDLQDRTVVIVDDGLATGVTATAALLSARARGAGRLILAVPVCAPDSAERIRQFADEVRCCHRPDEFVAVGRWYQRFDQTSDAEVLDILERHRDRGST